MGNNPLLESTSFSNLLDLPLEILDQILDHLQCDDLVTLSFLCRFFYLWLKFGYNNEFKRKLNELDPFAAAITLVAGSQDSEGSSGKINNPGVNWYHQANFFYHLTKTLSTTWYDHDAHLNSEIFDYKPERHNDINYLNKKANWILNALPKEANEHIIPIGCKGDKCTIVNGYYQNCAILGSSTSNNAIEINFTKGFYKLLPRKTQYNFIDNGNRFEIDISNGLLTAIVSDGNDYVTQFIHQVRLNGTGIKPNNYNLFMLSRPARIVASRENLNGYRLPIYYDDGLLYLPDYSRNGDVYIRSYDAYSRQVFESKLFNNSHNNLSEVLVLQITSNKHLLFVLIVGIHGPSIIALHKYEGYVVGAVDRPICLRNNYEFVAKIMPTDTHLYLAFGNFWEYVDIKDIVMNDYWTDGRSFYVKSNEVKTQYYGIYSLSIDELKPYYQQRSETDEILKVLRIRAKRFEGNDASVSWREVISGGLVDLNANAMEDSNFYTIIHMAISPNQRFLMYSNSTTNKDLLLIDLLFGNSKLYRLGASPIQNTLDLKWIIFNDLSVRVFTSSMIDILASISNISNAEGRVQLSHRLESQNNINYTNFFFHKESSLFGQFQRNSEMKMEYLGIPITNSKKNTIVNVSKMGLYSLSDF